MKYENRIVAFIDILGFANIIENTLNKVNHEKITELFDVFKRIRYLMGVDEPSDDIPVSRKVSQFSDSIFISFLPDDEPKEFGYLLGELLYLHVDLAKHKILIRGGIAFGPMVHTDEIIFGPALVHAFKLESMAASSPRIILPQSLYQVDSEFKNLVVKPWDKNKLFGLLSLDEDDFYYLDYFDKCQKPELGVFVEDKEYIQHLESMRDLIIEGLKTTNPGIYSKYGWMKSKWNKTVQKYHSAKELEKLEQESKFELLDYFKNAQPIQASM
jgi:hypothetical protein